MRKALMALATTAIMFGALPAAAQNTPRQAEREYRDSARDANREYLDNLRNADNRGDVRDARQEYREDSRDARQEYRDDRRNVNRNRRRNWQNARRYDYNRPPPGARRYYADQFYRDGGNYQSRRLTRNDRLYRGNDGRYYCRRSDGTTGLIIGGVAGGALGNVIAPGGSKTLGTILGALGGGVIGNSIDRNNVTCR